MHDEANPGFADMIDQTTLGHRLLKQQFGVAPRTTWQIDPFGHSAFQGSVMSSPVSGFNALFFMRADWQDIAHRQNVTETEFIWAPSPTLGQAGTTFAGILYGGYCTVDGLSMSIYSDNTPIMDDTRLEDFNVPAIVDRLVSIALDALKSVPQGGAGADGTRDIMLPLGCDFEWEAAGTWFTNTVREGESARRHLADATGLDLFISHWLSPFAPPSCARLCRTRSSTTPTSTAR